MPGNWDRWLRRRGFVILNRISAGFIQTQTHVTSGRKVGKGREQRPSALGMASVVGTEGWRWRDQDMNAQPTPRTPSGGILKGLVFMLSQNRKPRAILSRRVT